METGINTEFSCGKHSKSATWKERRKYEGNLKNNVTEVIYQVEDQLGWV